VEDRFILLRVPGTPVTALAAALTVDPQPLPAYRHLDESGQLATRPDGGARRASSHSPGSGGADAGAAGLHSARVAAAVVVVEATLRTSSTSLHRAMSSALTFGSGPSTLRKVSTRETAVYGATFRAEAGSGGAVDQAEDLRWGDAWESGEVAAGERGADTSPTSPSLWAIIARLRREWCDSARLLLLSLRGLLHAAQRRQVEDAAVATRKVARHVGGGVAVAMRGLTATTATPTLGQADVIATSSLPGTLFGALQRAAEEDDAAASGAWPSEGADAGGEGSGATYTPAAGALRERLIAWMESCVDDLRSLLSTAIAAKQAWNEVHAGTGTAAADGDHLLAVDVPYSDAYRRDAAGASDPPAADAVRDGGVATPPRPTRGPLATQSTLFSMRVPTLASPATAAALQRALAGPSDAALPSPGTFAAASPTISASMSATSAAAPSSSAYASERGARAVQEYRDPAFLIRLHQLSALLVHVCREAHLLRRYVVKAHEPTLRRLLAHPWITSASAFHAHSEPLFAEAATAVAEFRALLAPAGALSVGARAEGATVSQTAMAAALGARVG
jgi:hypothetical protein